MAKTPEKVDVYLETGAKRTFAGAAAWPGWSRSGRDAESALQALLDYGPRYAQVMQIREIAFDSPVTASAFNVIEQIEGNATTDFGAPGVAPGFDAEPVDAAELTRLTAVLQACWQTFDEIAQSAAGKALRAGPRGGGRPTDKILWHVINAEAGYLASLDGKTKMEEKASPDQDNARDRQPVRDTSPR
ncbi:MAG: hypothetical protein EHM21_06745, partial [Chloroflexi bacterium]